MDSEMRDSDQKIIKFEYDRNLSNNDFFVSKSNFFALKLMEGCSKVSRIFSTVWHFSV